MSCVPLADSHALWCSKASVKLYRKGIYNCLIHSFQIWLTTEPLLHETVHFEEESWSKATKLVMFSIAVQSSHTMDGFLGLDELEGQHRDRSILTTLLASR